jgi:hypothetical protein
MDAMQSSTRGDSWNPQGTIWIDRDTTNKISERSNSPRGGGDHVPGDHPTEPQRDREDNHEPLVYKLGRDSDMPVEGDDDHFEGKGPRRKKRHNYPPYTPYTPYRCCACNVAVYAHDMCGLHNNVIGELNGKDRERHSCEPRGPHYVCMQCGYADGRFAMGRICPCCIHLAREHIRPPHTRHHYRGIRPNPPQKGDPAKGEYRPMY